jgi:hypothetical protein
MSKDIYDWIREYRSLRTDQLYPFDNTIEKNFAFRKEEILSKKAKFEEVKLKIDDITVRQLGQCKKNLVMSIDKALELLANNKLDYSLSRNQGLIIPNYVYGKIWGIVESAMNTAQGFSYPGIYFASRGDFDSSALQKLLTDFKLELLALRPASFFDLEHLYEKYATELKHLWEKENKMHPDGGD